MKLYIYKVSFVLLSLVYCGLSRGQVAHKTDMATLTLTDDDSGKAFNVAKHTIVKLALSNSVDGGYILNEAVYNKNILKLIKQTDKPPAPHSVMGKPGLASWKFETLKKGRSSIYISASRPWAKNSAVTIFTCILKVK